MGKRVFKEIAKKRDGKLVYTKLIFLKGLEIPLKDHRLLVSHKAASKDASASTDIECDLNDDYGFTLNVNTDNIYSQMAKSLGEKDVLIGNPVFDDVFVVNSNNEQLAKQFLEPDLQEILLEYKDATPGIRVGKSKFQLYISAIVLNVDKLDKLIGLSMSLINKLVSNKNV